MGLKKYIKKYKDYESKELARRRKIKTYKALKKKKLVIKKPDVSFDKMAYAKAIGNPYGTKFPKAKKVLKKARKAKRKKLKKKVVVVYS